MRAENDSTYLIRWVELNCLVEIILRKEHKPKPAPNVYTWLSKLDLWHFPVQHRMYCLLWCMKFEICSSLAFPSLAVECSVFFPVAHGIYLTVAQNVPQLKLHTESCVWVIMIWWHLEYVRLLAVCSNHSLNELEMCLCSSELFECLRHNSTKKGKFLSGCM